MATIFNQTFRQKLIYMYRINDRAHEGILKIGEASCDAGMDYFSFTPCCKELNEAAKERIRHQTQTAGIPFELLYTEVTAYMRANKLVVFQDHEVHNVLKRSGVKPKVFDKEHNANEWFYTDLETVKKAIAAVKEGRSSLNASEISRDKSPVMFRPEQSEAIEKTIKQFKKANGSRRMLWNAKMRFGKTLSALEVVKHMNFCRTLILTHRPVVDSGWFEDYGKIFYDRHDFDYFSKKNGGDPDEEKKFREMICGADKNGLSDYHFIYFASIQDMRGSEIVGGKFAKNEKIFSVNWDFIIIDEAHEGTQTELGKAVLAACQKDNTRILHLSGTPFNLMDDFKEEEIYTWDYVMEQQAKVDWDIIHQGDPNPYAVLPKLSIFTYDLGKLYPDYADADIAFNFREFFRVDEEGDFIHEDNVKQFLDLLSKKDDDSNYPYSKEEYRQNFRHSLWMIPGVKEAKALSRLMKDHPVFGQFEIANVAGDGDEEVDSKDALALVEKAIGKNPEETYSVTLSCGRLTTGVSVKPWTACLMLSGSYNTAASTYMQTIFRVQTPAVIGGKQKEECFVFDFAPDRTLKVIAETAKISSKAGKTTQDDREILGNFLNFCPIIGFEGSEMKVYDTEKMLGQLKKAYVERVVKNGFEDNYLYNDELLCMNKLELKAFEKLKEIIGSTKAQSKTGEININAQGLTDEQYEMLAQPEIRQKPLKELTPEQQEALDREKEIKKNRDAAISILRGISIRMPLLLYGADVPQKPDGTEQPITLENFAELVDDLSWEEFMPKGVTKELFGQFKKYYDADVFRESGVRIREMARAADRLSIEERIERISTLFATFRNPDKETVLTPWRVVNMHLAESLGGWRFYDKDFKEPISKPEMAKQKNVTDEVFKSNTRILEINAKSGLYALWCAYSVYRARAKLEIGPKPSREMQKGLWNRVLAENIFLICKTPMAKKIAQRTLAGFSGTKVNAHYFEDLVNQLKNKSETFTEKVSKASYWKLKNKDGNEDMKFDAVVGNPPYQETMVGTSDNPIYNYFYDAAFKLSDIVSLITPARYLYNAGKTSKEWNEKMLNDEHLKVVLYEQDSSKIFPNTSIKGGLAITLRDANKNFGKIGFFTNFPELQSILKKVRTENFETIADLVYAPESYRLSKKLHEEHPEIKEKLSAGHDFDVTSNIFGKLDHLFTNEKPRDGFDYIKIFGLDGTKRTSKYIRKDYIDPHENLMKYKVFVPKSNGTGAIGEVLSTPVIGHPVIGHTQTFISIGKFDTKKEAEACLKYIKTKFARVMLGTLKITQDNKKATWANVPLQDFTPNSDIDWNKPIADIDRQLYKKYNLSEEEIAFIESKVKAME
ncbi:MAG: DEAD/DEAH box helicase family protein [Treponema sp.]|nr:DEAD/DEAH box helicase family protein [Treponema sp.]